MIETNSLTTIK